MGREPVATRVPSEVAENVEQIANSPVTRFDTEADVLRAALAEQIA